MSVRNSVIGALLDRLEEELKAADVWHLEKPDAKAFESTAPFCVDTMEFSQWVQFVYLVKMRELIAMGVELPAAGSGVAPMAEEVWAGESFASLLAVFREIDSV